ncbi:serine/threonine-protein kinase [Streptomyces sp. NPDC006530]|uniref:serine/threonine-protein kinase n=1 Tax=Streptomyces sp. NPDC006530 TaxID=3364750 RepID=UPI00368EE5E5
MAEQSVIADRYQLLGRLGSGGMGEVYEALDVKLERRVAVKMIRSDLGGSDMRERFGREARALARVAHPNTVVVHDVGLHGDVPYLVMELLEGVDLRSLLGRRSRLPHALVRAVAAGMCSGLAAVHEAGILHRDVKPGNVHLTRAGRVVLQDFGIAHLLDATHQTATGVVVGTPSYMAPEVVRGEAPGPYTDLYALGVCVFEMLAGEQPFSGGSMVEVIFKIVQEEAPRLRARPHTPDDLADLVRDLMAKEPTARPTAAGTLERLRCPPNAAELIAETVTEDLRARAVRDFGQAPAAVVGGPGSPPAVAGRDATATARVAEMADLDARVPHGTSALALSEATRSEILHAMTPAVAEARQREAVGMVLRGSLEEAVGLLSRLADACRASLGPVHPTTLTCVYWQGVCLARLGAGDHAVAKFAEVSAAEGTLLE